MISHNHRQPNVQQSLVPSRRGISSTATERPIAVACGARPLLTHASVRMLRRSSHDAWISTGSTMWTGACTSNHGSITDQW